MPVTNPDIILYVRKKLGPGNWKWERVEEIRGRHTSSIHGKFAFRPTIGGKQLIITFDLDTKGADPIFRPGYFASLGCVSKVSQ